MRDEKQRLLFVPPVSTYALYLFLFSLLSCLAKWQPINVKIFIQDKCSRRRRAFVICRLICSACAASASLPCMACAATESLSLYNPF